MINGIHGLYIYNQENSCILTNHTVVRAPGPWAKLVYNFVEIYCWVYGDERSIANYSYIGFVNQLIIAGYNLVAALVVGGILNPK